ncbi:MAG: YcxB family protein [Clostridia bacterium]|nr:YcxB family protein [Clostridia bacterium]
MKVVTHYNREMLQEFFRFTLLRTKRGRRKLPWVVFFSAVVYIFSAVILVSRGIDSKTWFLFLLSGLVLFMDAIVFYAFHSAGKSIDQTNPAMLTAVNEYSFESRYIEVKTVGSNEKADRVRYDQLLKVIKTPRYFYLFLTETSAYIISREEIIEDEKETVTDGRKGNVDDKLAHFLQEKMGTDGYFERAK